MAVWSMLADLISLLSKRAQKTPHCAEPSLLPQWCWLGEFGMRPLEECVRYCTFGPWVVCVCKHFCTVCSPPLELSQCLHPNHNYNVISRVRQYPCCCFTFSSSSLLWISNALTLSSESCPALSQTHTRMDVWGGDGWVHLIVLFLLRFWQEEPAVGLRILKIARTFHLICC